MVHPTCAPARPPNVPPASEDSPNSVGDLVVAAATTAAADLSALREAYRATACVHDLLLLAQRSPKSERNVSRTEVESLVALVNAEFERRIQCAKASIASMQVTSEI
jgi:hypothetical protein